jgi:hypothetical protein
MDLFVHHLDQPTGQPTEPGARVPNQSNTTRPRAGHSPCTRMSHSVPAQAKASSREPTNPMCPDPCDSAIFRLSSDIWRYCQQFSGFAQPFYYSELNHFWYSELSHFYLQ